MCVCVWGAINLWIFFFNSFEGCIRKLENLLPVTWCGRVWSWADEPGSRSLWCQPALLTLIYPDNHFQTSLSCSRSGSVIHLSVIQLSGLFISECVCELQTCCAPLSALLPLLSLPSPLAGTGRVKGGRASVCQVGLVLQPQQQHTVIRVGRKQPLRLGSIKL